MGNTDHTPTHIDIDEENGNSAQSAQSAKSPNTPEQSAQPELTPAEGAEGGNSTTGKGGVEQDDEDVGGDQDRAPEPKIAPVLDKDDADEVNGRA